MNLKGEEHHDTFMAANNYALSLFTLKRFEEAKAFLRRSTPVARRVLGESDELTLKMRWNYALSLYEDPAATLDDLSEAVTTNEEIARTARRVFGGEHPSTVEIELHLRTSRAALHAREGDGVSSACEAVDKMTMRK